MSRFYCGTKKRRWLVQNDDDLNGIDYLEVRDRDLDEDDEFRQMVLNVFFLNDTGFNDLDVENVIIEGGERIRGINVMGVKVHPGERVMTVTVNKRGDFSPYTLKLITTGDVDSPPDYIDPILSSVQFSFKVEAPNDFDLMPEDRSVAGTMATPPIDYLAKDYASFRQQMLDRLAVTIPDWQETSPADLGMALVEVLAYAADQLSYYQDAVATEAYLGTARTRPSLRRHARLLDYQMHEGCNARTWIHIKVENSRANDFILPAHQVLHTTIAPEMLARLSPPAEKREKMDIGALLGTGATIFETMHDLELHQAHNKILLYSWGEEYCILPAGSVSATLENEWLDSDPGNHVGRKLDHLQMGDLLLFEELAPGPGGGEADPTHRHVVRLTALKRTEDPLIKVVNGSSRRPTRVVRVTWSLEDALHFPLPIGKTESSDFSVARGNIVLADHGATFSGEKLEPHKVPSRGNYRPRIYRDDITYRQPYDHNKASAQPAAGALNQDTRKSLPGITLKETESGSQWRPQRDLLGSDRFAHEFVLEYDGNRYTQLRFGDNILGKRPAAGLEFDVTCRIGNGKAGNVGAGVLSMLNLKGTDLLSGDIAVTNPLPASGGTERENMEQTRLFAPHRFRIPERAVTADDYARMAQRHPNVQNAAGILRWTGSWNTVYILVDRSGGLHVDKNFKAEMGAFLERYRLAGHVLEIRDPQFVFLHIALEVHAKPGHLRSDLKRALLDILVGRGDEESGKKAIFHPDNFTFGQNVYLSQVVSAAAKIPGVESILPIRFQRWGLPYKGEREAAVVQIDPLEVARLDNDPNAPEKGRIEFIMRGGM